MNVANRPLRRTALCMLILCGFYASAASADAISGAIFTTDQTGNQVNGNNYDGVTHLPVYLNGGPSNAPGCHGGALEDGVYYFQVTDPSGAHLLSNDPITNRKFQVSAGEISANLGAPTAHANGAISRCGSHSIQLMPFDTTTNPGGVYKVWITRVSDFEAFCGVGVDCGLAGFVPGHTKTDNFRLATSTPPPPLGSLQAYKFYDTNANGIFDYGDLDLADWQMTLQSTHQSVDSTRFTDASGSTTWTPLVPDNDYSVTEGTPIEGNWVHSATIFSGHAGTTPVNPAGPLTVVANQTTTVAFGNYCTVPPNGRTLGFWSNRNGQALVGSTDLAMLTALNLKNGTGGNFDPANYSSLRTWLLNGTAVNMAYMLSVQLAAMELNVYNGLVNGGATYVPAGRTINQLMSDANDSLGQHPLTLDGSQYRSSQEQLKNWLDQLNNNAGVLSPTPCAHTFN